MSASLAQECNEVKEYVHYQKVYVSDAVKIY